MSEERIMTAEEFFGGIESDKGRGSMSSPRRRKASAKKSFADIKARMVMRIYGVTREKAERIISERAVAKTNVGEEAGPNGVVGDRGADEVEMMSVDEFFRS